MKTREMASAMLRAWSRGADSRLEHNRELERQTAAERERGDGHIAGQGGEAVRDMRFGPLIEERYGDGLFGRLARRVNKALSRERFGTVAGAGCEAIAVYNVLRDLGKSVPLSQIIYDIERRGYMVWHGWLGTRTNRLGALLRLYGVKCRAVSPRRVQARADSGRLRSGSVFALAIFNNAKRPLTAGMHCFEAVYTPSADPQRPWTAYNRYNNRTAPERYPTLSAAVGKGKISLMYEATIK